MPFDRFMRRATADGASGSPYVFLETRRAGAGDTRSMWFEDPVEELRLLPTDDATAYFGAIEGALAAGFWVAGYIEYEAGYMLERSLGSHVPGLSPDTPLAWFGVFREPQTSQGGGPERAPVPSIPVAGTVSDVTMAIDAAAYAHTFDRVHHAIEQGDIYQLNLTTRTHFEVPGPPEHLYLSLRHRQTAAYSACLRDGRRTVISLSPERFLSRRGDVVTMQPMKGTAPRADTRAEDAQLRRWLGEDEKNRAENVMIVDMVRNDLGRVAVEGSVTVDELFEVEPLETAWQMTSTVSAHLRPDTSWAELMRAVFPCASITGAPKIRAMQMIAELESQPRGIYTGAIGFISPDNEASFSVAIRTAVIDDDGHGVMGLGSGIVFDSSADAEYEECLLKGRFLTELANPFSLVETMRMENGAVSLRNEHLARLERSARALGFECDTTEVASRLDALCGDGRARARRARLLLEPSGRFDIEVSDLPGDDARPWRVALWDEPVDPTDAMLYHKTTRRPMYDRARAIATGHGLDEVIFVNTGGELTEGTITNLFVQIDGTLVTPPVSAGLLPGTLREVMLAKGECRERVLFAADLDTAQAAYVGNSVRGLVKISLTGTLSSGGLARGASEEVG